ncbi:MAG TPA: nucleotidyltransferase domain-containing protein [Polyangiaceae bacterium]|jgi:predicted nucleotidyltransferase
MSQGEIARTPAEEALFSHLRGELAAHPGVRLAILFGSRARGSAHEASDVDVAVLAPKVDLLALGAALSRVTGETVNLLSLADPGVPLLEELLRDGILLCEGAPGALGQWRSHALMDLELDRPWYERMRDAWLDHVARHGV